MPKLSSTPTALSKAVLDDLKAPIDYEKDNERAQQATRDLTRNLREYGFTEEHKKLVNNKEGVTTIDNIYKNAFKKKINKEMQEQLTEEQIEYFSDLIKALSDQTVIAPQSAALYGVLEENNYGFKNLSKLERSFEEINGEYCLKYALEYPIYLLGDLHNPEDQNIPAITQLTTEYTFSPKGQVSVSVSSDKLDSQLLYKCLRSITSGAPEQTMGDDSKKYSPKYDILILEGCNQLVQALENNIALLYIISEGITIEEFKKRVEEVEDSLSPSAKDKITPEFYKDLEQQLEVVNALEIGLSKMTEDQITEVARGILKFGKKDEITRKNNEEIYNALSPEAKRKIDVICDRLENRSFLTKIIDYLAILFFKVPDIARDLTTKPNDKEIKDSAKISNQGESPTIA
jgi:hypothetical protein